MREILLEIITPTPGHRHSGGVQFAGDATLRGENRRRGQPAEADINIAVAELEKELASSELVDQINLNINVIPPQDTAN
jgi:hypothetical protein